MRSIRQQITENLIPVFRRKLSGVDALPQLAVLGLLSGIVTGGVILFPLRKHRGIDVAGGVRIGDVW